MIVRLTLSEKIHDDMIAQALAERPNECCGLLAGIVDEPGGVAKVIERYALVNIAERPTVEYLSDAKGMLFALRDMERRGLDLLAVYHSHPTSLPIPSRKDLEMNTYPEVVKFIISLVSDPPSMRGWYLSDSGPTESHWEKV